ncbi:hypothetical protein LEMLEM_LOCUS21664 [Lemmus lemmus]
MGEKEESRDRKHMRNSHSSPSKGQEKLAQDSGEHTKICPMRGGSMRNSKN